MMKTMTLTRMTTAKAATVLSVLYLACAVVAALPMRSPNMVEDPYVTEEVDLEWRWGYEEDEANGRAQQVVVLDEEYSSEGDPEFKGWYDPRVYDGRMLDVRVLSSFHIPADNNDYACILVQFTTRRFGEPLNVIISAFSDPYILTESGIHTYAK